MVGSASQRCHVHYMRNVLDRVKRPLLDGRLAAGSLLIINAQAANGHWVSDRHTC